MPRYITVEEAVVMVKAYNADNTLSFKNIPWCGDYGCDICVPDDLISTYQLKCNTAGRSLILDSSLHRAHCLSVALFRQVIGERVWNQGIHNEIFILKNGRRTFGVSRYGRVVRNREAIRTSSFPHPEVMNGGYYPAACYWLRGVPEHDIATAVAINLLNLKGEDLKAFLKIGGKNHVLIRIKEYYSQRVFQFSTERPVVVLEPEGKL